MNAGRLELAIIDAVGKGIGAVLMSTAVIKSLRFSRRCGADLRTAYEQADDVIHSQFGGSAFVTGQAASFDMATGELTWLNAGHPLPMLARNGTYGGELPCAPSVPFGLGGPVVEVAVTLLQPGDRVLFYTDGVTEAVGSTRERFGEERLADYFVRATLDHIDLAETARRLSARVLEFAGDSMSDDATMLLLEYRKPH